ncbi:CobW family GTP-binding protein [Tissierella sp.]|uniref:CobW family GTP-binding protein n=1 Tax=Tissierella sp. TaxID=41274 RepID=UPI00286483C1|nr:CobW family GTP-binding protein [Tissierella sp.]MDR7856824.1 CobW family GTP-binding protein [Tissierella sp.]
MDNKINLYLLTGFLGSGKTTLLTNILEDLSGEKVGVIMNEFGRISIDGEIIKKEGMEIVEINRGSIFCSCLKLNFAQAMIEMSERDLKYLFVESSGLADPSNIGEILGGIEATKGDLYNYKGAICIIDGENFLDQLDDLETVERQIKHCHLAVISKVDLIDDETLAKIIEKIKEINSIVPIETMEFGKLDYDYLNEDLMQYKWAESEETTNGPETKPKTLMLTYDGEIQKENLIKFLDAIKPDAYRLKGFLKLEDGWNQVDVVGKRIDFKLIDEEYENSQLVIISKIGPQIIRPIANSWKEIFEIEMKLK